MSESLVVCDVAEDLVEKLRKFRFRKETHNAAIIMKIDKDKRLVVLDEELEGVSPDELKDELPERQPRPSLCIVINTSTTMAGSPTLCALSSPVLWGANLSSR
nr:glia maturation factor beta isoform X3 [Rattus norvegicus]